LAPAGGVGTSSNMRCMSFVGPPCQRAPLQAPTNQDSCGEALVSCVPDSAHNSSAGPSDANRSQTYVRKQGSRTLGSVTNFEANRPRRLRRRSSVLLIAALLGLSSCGSSEYLVVGHTAAVPTQGVLEVEELDGGNVFVHLDLDYLPPPSRLDEAGKLYVVWFLADGKEPFRAGQMAYDPTAQGGRMSATFPARKFEVLITAERGPDAASPSEHVAVRQAVDMDE
ncbi:MAG: hypothetical protein MJD61_04345, partial [Proteobacteria bacterium]|nr:hypothetical protein [Pseudomonadota bacterium]